MNWWPAAGLRRPRRAGERETLRTGLGRGVLRRRLPTGWRGWIWPASTAAALVLLHAMLLPVVPRIDTEFPRVGEIAPHDITAPFAFSAPYLDQDIKMRQMQQMMVEPPVLRPLKSGSGSALVRLDAWRDAVVQQAALTNEPLSQRIGAVSLSFPEFQHDDIAHALTLPDPAGFFDIVESCLRRVLDGGVVDFLPTGTYRQVRIVSPAGETLVDASTVTAQGDLEARLQRDLAAAGLPESEAAWAARVVRPLVSPNLVYGDEDTRARRLQASRDVPTVREFLSGERVIEKGVQLTEQDSLYLDALMKKMVDKGDASTGGELAWRQAARSLLALGLLLLYGWIATLYFPELLTEPRRLLTAAVLLVLVLAAAAVCLSRPSLGPFAVPIPLLSVLVTVLLRDRVGYATTILAASWLGFHAGAGTAWVLAWLVTGLVAVTLMRRIRQRDQYYQAIAILSAVGVLLASLLRITGGVTVGGFLHEAVVAALSPVVSVMLALFLLPIIEPVVGVCSDLTLLELSDLNHPLLKKMALESQGTFHHSQVVAQLAEAGARAIGANSLLTRVGALFHDIGKMNKPEYYVENQGGGPNKHDELSPSMSALVVASHVKDGIAMGRRWRLPEAVIAFIPEHHGTSVMKFFYHKALQSSGNETVKVDDFRYPGPKPRRRETAILMLADAVEAATRALAKPTPGRIREVVKQVADERMLSGELDECGLTLRDIAGIREAFIPLLAGIHHSRISYPGQREFAAVQDAKERS